MREHLKSFKESHKEHLEDINGASKDVNTTIKSLERYLRRLEKSPSLLDDHLLTKSGLLSASMDNYEFVCPSENSAKIFESIRTEVLSRTSHIMEKLRNDRPDRSAEIEDTLKKLKTLFEQALTSFR